MAAIDPITASTPASYGPESGRLDMRSASTAVALAEPAHSYRLISLRLAEDGQSAYRIAATAKSDENVAVLRNGGVGHGIKRLLNSSWAARMPHAYQGPEASPPWQQSDNGISCRFVLEVLTVGADQ